MRLAGFCITSLTALLLVSGCGPSANGEPLAYSISGRMLNSTSGSGIANATVTLRPGALSMQTAADGSYSFDQVEQGSYVITVASIEGFGAVFPQTLEVSVGPDSEGNDFRAAPLPGPAVQSGQWDFGDLIYSLPVDSAGQARVNVANFAPGQQAAFVVINMDPLFRDAHANASGDFPPVPASGYSYAAYLVSSGASLASPSRAALNHSVAQQSGCPLLPDPDQGTGYPRATIAGDSVQFAPQPTRSTTLLQKGELRTFLNVPQRTVQNPPIQPGAADPTRDLAGLRWPLPYNSQDGRLVAVGQHCLIFLSTEINNGHPDNIRFTQARLNRLAAEFDTNIFPVATATFGPVKNYQDPGVYRDVDRSLVLTGDDFDNAGHLTRVVPGSVDFSIADEGKILIFLTNGAAGKFFTFGATLETGQHTAVGSTLYLGGDNFQGSAADFEAAYSLLAHELQHKLYHDNALPERSTEYDWLSEGLSQLSLFLCGYTPNSGRLVPWAVDTQLVDYLGHTSSIAVPMDANPYFSQDQQYGAGLLFFLYMFEHYDPGAGRRIYDAASKDGLSDRIQLVERGAQSTVDGEIRQDTFEQLYAKFALANFIDGINTADVSRFDDRFHYETIDLRGTVNLSNGTFQLPGVNAGVFPSNGEYPATGTRYLIPWGVDYIVLGDGDGRDLDVQFRVDRNYKIFLLPVSAADDSTIRIDSSIQLGY